MATYSDWEQRQMDAAMSEELDRVSARLVARGVCPHCGGSGRVLWGYAGERTFRSRPCVCQGES